LAGFLPVIFDCDGVLVDSEPIAIRELCRSLSGLGIAVTEDDAYRRFLGRGWSAVVEAVTLGRGRPITDAETAAFRAALFARFRTDLRPMAGIAACLDRLAGRPMGVASSSIPERLTLSLDVTGLMPRFAPHVYSASAVPRGKPAPDLFLLAADRLGVAPADCVVVEDSPTGIEAARAAGMRTVAFLGGSHVGPGGLADAVAALRPDATIHHLAELPDLILGWERRVAD
jgi:HAD superfamily hydrolase (TIGR01509 family)